MKKFKYWQSNYSMVRKRLNSRAPFMVSWRRGSLTRTGDTMVAFVKISKKGTLLRIKEVSDKYRDKSYCWGEDE
ncbi:MAG: hypothetical protein MUO73_08890 [Thermoplasmata archaeon]|nr:hypothetical protein [Thermoplasmata archaeon]